MAETRSLHRKLAQVMYEVERIPKNGVAPAAMGGFKFVQVGDAADVIRKALAEKRVSMIPTSIELIDSAEHMTSNQKAMTTVTVRTTWTLTDGDSGESIVIQSMGSGADTGDKAIPKAQSNAMKYALLMGFLLSTGDDPELSDSSDRKPKGPPAPPQLDPAVDGLIGTAVKQPKATTDFNLRQSPDGPFIGFRLKNGNETGFICEVRGPMAEALKLIEDDVIGKRVQVWGTWIEYKPPVVEYGYRAFRVDRIQTPDITLPAPDAASTELASLPMFDEPAA